MNRENGQIFIWMNNSNDPNLILYTNLSVNSYAIFVTTNGDIYVGSHPSVKQIIKSNQTISISIPSASSSYILGIFVDINNTLYCSFSEQYKIVKKWLNDSSSTMTTVAGTGSAGSASNMLNWAHGIFVDTNFDLYVADASNNRIQLFRLGEINGTTIAGSTSANITISLSYPTAIILDGNKYLFITDAGNSRIVGSDENGFRCIIACSGSSGLTSYQLYGPRSIVFDSFGNLFVADQANDRIQKFCLSTNFCNNKKTMIRYFHLII